MEIFSNIIIIIVTQGFAVFSPLLYICISSLLWDWCLCTNLPINYVNNCVASGGGCPRCPGASTLAQPAPRQSCAPMAGKPVPSSHEPPRQAKGTSELNAKLGEKGLMAGRSLSPNTPNPEAPTYAEHEETYKG